MTSRGERQLSDGEMRDGAALLLRRLTRHLDSWDAGDASARGDVAGVTRTALALGKGDAVVRRLVQRFRLLEPVVTVGRRIDPSGRFAFAFGGVPVDRSELKPNADAPPIAQELELTEWLGTPAVIASTARRKQTAWHQLISDFGNTYGAHLSNSVPDVLEQTLTYRGPSDDLGGFALRSAAIVAERTLGAALAALDVEGPFRQDRLFFPDGHAITYLHVQETAKVGIKVDFQQGASEDHDLLRVPLSDHEFTISWTRIDDDRGHLVFGISPPLAVSS